MHASVRGYRILLPATPAAGFECSATWRQPEQAHCLPDALKGNSQSCPFEGENGATEGVRTPDLRYHKPAL